MRCQQGKGTTNTLLPDTGWSSHWTSYSASISVPGEQGTVSKIGRSLISPSATQIIVSEVGFHFYYLILDESIGPSCICNFHWHHWKVRKETSLINIGQWWKFPHCVHWFFWRVVKVGHLDFAQSPGFLPVFASTSAGNRKNPIWVKINISVRIWSLLTSQWEWRWE